MTTNQMRLVAGFLSVIALSVSTAHAQSRPLIIANVRGSLNISQGVPCGDVVEATTSIADGLMHISPSQQRGDTSGADTVFDLTRLEVFFTPFSVQAECLGLKANLEFREIGVRLASAIQFTGQHLGGGQYRFVIPRERFLIYESVMTNLPGPQPIAAYKRPSEDVTGEIDTRRGTVELHVALFSRLRVRFGCTDNGKRCAIDEVVEGTQTTDVSGSVHPPDADGAPTLSCAPTAHPRRYRVTATDDGGWLSLKLDTFSLDNGEVIQIEETGRPGVRFMGTVGPDRVRHFLVGKGQALVTATDEAGNVAHAACAAPPGITTRQ